MDYFFPDFLKRILDCLKSETTRSALKMKISVHLYHWNKISHKWRSVALIKEFRFLCKPHKLCVKVQDLGRCFGKTEPRCFIAFKLVIKLVIKQQPDFPFLWFRSCCNIYKSVRSMLPCYSETRKTHSHTQPWMIGNYVLRVSSIISTLITI